MISTTTRLPEPVVYFAYGSNLDPERMAQRCPGAVPLDSAELDGHRVVIGERGVATVVREAGSTTVGICWQLRVDHEAALDRVEGVALGLYQKMWLEVRPLGGPTLNALTYVEEFRGAGRPRPGYLETIVRGARWFGLPDDYIQQLQLLAAPVVTS